MSADYINGHLLVTFRDGSRYQYANVPEATYNQLLRAKSPGTFLHQTIKPKFKAAKIAHARKP